jgi:alkylation response protein AidB-like acyl-CoA dehydrogenase
LRALDRPRASLFGTPEQQAKYLPKSVTGEWINAFTEPDDAANNETRPPTEEARLLAQR